MNNSVVESVKFTIYYSKSISQTPLYLCSNMYLSEIFHSTDWILLISELKYMTPSLKPHTQITNHYSSAQRHWSASVYCISLFLPEQQCSCSKADTTAMSDAVLIEKLINFLKSSAVIPANQSLAWPRETNFISVLMTWDPQRGYMGTFGHWKYHL